MKSVSQIFCMGGGGWIMDEAASPMESYLYKLANKDKPKICLLPTACGDSTLVTRKYYASALSLSTLSRHNAVEPP